MTAGWARGVEWMAGALVALLPALAVAGEPAMRTRTASAEFDRLFALAQTELEQDKVDAITDWSFNDQKPFPCVCFETGEKWHYVWTRDLSYAADLALARLDPERTKTSLRFKLGRVRTQGIPGIDPGSWMVAQDTGSGGSWPISTDRVVWFLAARHLVEDDAAFRRQVREALDNTLQADDTYAFDQAMGLYRGETSFLDWREQNYPAWTAKDTTWIGESFALSTNVLHYDALRFGAELHAGDAKGRKLGKKADALRVAIDRHFWNESRGMYRSYIGPAWAPVPVESYDLLGTSLAVLSGVAPPSRAQRALANYPAVEFGSPVIWPQQPDTPIYHNRAMWPFVSAYALRAARSTRNAERIEHEIRSLMRGTARAGSNMENYELLTQRTHVEDGKSSGPVVNSPRQLWSVAGYLDMVMRGVFGVEEGGRVAPMLPAGLAKDLFGDRGSIALELPDRRIVLRKPASLEHGTLLVSGPQHVSGRDTTVDLVAQRVVAQPLVLAGAQFAPPPPGAPEPARNDTHWSLSIPAGTMLYVNGVRSAPFEVDSVVHHADRGTERCFTATRVVDGIESLPSPTTCVGPAQTFAGGWPRTWTPAKTGRYRASFRYRNASGPINTGITAAVRHVAIECGRHREWGTIVMPHNEAATDSTSWIFEAPAGQACLFYLTPGHNMSQLDHFANYTGGKGGATGPLNDAVIESVTIQPLP